MNKIQFWILIGIIFLFILFLYKNRNDFFNTEESFNTEELFNTEESCINNKKIISIQIPENQNASKIIYWTVDPIKNSSLFDNSGIVNINNNIANINLLCSKNSNVSDIYIYYRIVNIDGILSDIYIYK